jgi:hypothetical protein
MLKIIGLDNEIHAATDIDPFTAECGETLGDVDAVNPAVAVPLTCQPCRFVIGNRRVAREIRPGTGIAYDTPRG